MEKQITDLSILKIYKNRQVVLNYYQDEDFLLKRDGFYFESLDVSEKTLHFKGKNPFLISLVQYPEWYSSCEFPNYFFLKNCTNRIEVYFP